MVRDADIVHLHLPQFDAPGVAIRGKLMGKPVILTYHSDLRLPDGPLNRIAEQVVNVMNRLAGSLSDAVVTYTYDFGTHSPFLSRYLDRKLYVISPPVELFPVDDKIVNNFRSMHDLVGKRVIGISARIAAEKGIEVLLRALPLILERHPDAHVIQANPAALGESAYQTMLEPLFEQYKANYHLLGPLFGADLSAFYRSLDCLVMCSLNNTETFGLVQIEAMMSGTPVVSSDLPGVRQPVMLTGMGEVTPVGDHNALADAIVRILDNRESYQRPSKIIADSFDPDASAAEYIDLFQKLLNGDKGGRTVEPGVYRNLRIMKDGYKTAGTG
jgi:glycosyltransferase involved in cell wall biosynthesis